MESDFAAYLLQIVRDGGAAAGGALFVGAILMWLVLTGRLVPKSQYVDMRAQRERYRRELREERRAHRNTVDSYKSSVLPGQEE